MLIANGAAVDAAAVDGRTSLLIATMRNDLEAVQLLIQKGANVDAVDDSGQTSLMHAEIQK